MSAPQAHDPALGLFATVSAAVAEGDRPLREVLASFSLTSASWEAMSIEWNTRLAHEVMGDAAESPLADAFAVEFAAAQDRLRPLPSMSPEEWAELSVDHASDPAGALLRRELRAADLARLSRHFAQALRDRALARRYFDAYYRAQRQITSAARAASPAPSGTPSASNR